MSGPSQPPGKGFITPTKHRRSRGSLHATPRSAAYSLGRHPSTPDIDTQGLEMNVFDINSPRSPPPTDPMADFYQEVSVGDLEYTKSIKQDLEILKESGFIIDYKNGFLGNGFYGEVYKGVYGPIASKLKDLKGNLLKNVGEGQPFAVKLVDFLAHNKKLYSLAEILEKRESYEMEKYIMTFFDHPNITTIRMAINMGEPQEFKYQKANEYYIQHERVYLFMDLAQLGSLKDYLKRHLEPSEKFKLVRDCFAGLKYLHDNKIAHGDVHLGNILIFQEDDVVAKWCDFGLAFVSKKGEYIYNSKARKRQVHNFLVKQIRKDCERFANVVYNIMKDSKNRSYQPMISPEELTKYPPDIQHMLIQYWQMIEALRYATTLDEVLQRFQDELGYREKLV